MKFTVGLFNDTSVSNHFGCDLVIYQLNYLLNKIGGEIIWTWPVGNDWRGSEAQILTKQRPDVVLVNGEGSIHHSETRSRAQYLPLLSRFVKEVWSIPVILINATLHELRDEEIALIADFDLISVRDFKSATLISEVREKVFVTGDLTLTAHANVPENRKRHIKTLVTDSVIPNVKDSLFQFAFANRYRYLNLTHNGSLPKQMKTELRRDLDFDELFNESSGIALLNYLSLVRRVITGRYHCVTLCLLTKTPFIAIESNTPKISRLLNDVFGSESSRIKVEVTGLDLSSVLNFSNEEEDSINNYVRRVSEQYDSFFCLIKRIISR